MKIEIATIYNFTKFIKIDGVFLLIWRVKFFRNLINAPRVIGLRFVRGKIFSSPDYAEVKRVSDALKSEGVAFSNIENFMDMPNLSELTSEFSYLLELEKSTPHERQRKNYIERLIDDDYDFSINQGKAFYKFVNSYSLQSIAALYLGLIPKKTSFKIWRSYFDGKNVRLASQNWHRDFNEFQMLRVFLYLNDVKAENGASEYIKRTHYLGDSYNELQYSEENGHYCSDEIISSTFTPDRIVVGEGRPGTILFFDTAGLHRGGYHKIPSERRIALLTFSTAADILPTKIKL